MVTFVMAERYALGRGCYEQNGRMFPLDVAYILQLVPLLEKSVSVENEPWH
jgi:hypothetical protein